MLSRLKKNNGFSSMVATRLSLLELIFGVYLLKCSELRKKKIKEEVSVRAKINID